MGAEKVLSIFVAAICVVMLIRMALGDQRRARWDRAFLRAWAALRLRALRLWHWREHRASAAQAQQAAQDVINRVRHRVDKDGNVYTPEAFKGPRKPH
jgi:cyanate permease